MDVFDMPGYVRISIGRPEDNAQAIAALAQVLQEL
jgi:histidinol-phosphate/aromatic aminotransferase/cobyric acid decarboxylase-like protein